QLTRSLSDARLLPTHGLGFFASRSNSAVKSVDQAPLSARTAALSVIVRAMAFLQQTDAHYIADFSHLRTGRNRTFEYEIAPGDRDRRLHEGPAGRAAVAARPLGRRRLRTRGRRACRPPGPPRGANGAERHAAHHRGPTPRTRRPHHHAPDP